MKVSLIAIGNSRGIRLPKAVLEQCGFGDSAEMTVERGRVVLSPSKKARAGWAEAFAKADTSLNKEDRDWIETDFGGEWD